VGFSDALNLPRSVYIVSNVRNLNLCCIHYLSVSEYSECILKLVIYHYLMDIQL
jgi:hypothetical protein